MTLKLLLVLVTVIAVVGDSLLIPFYPHYFAEVFGLRDPEHVGFYIGASCFTVMAAFPFWAWVARYLPALRLLVYTQLAAGLLCLLSYGAGSLPIFWLMSLGMFAFKASYLLIYPYLLSEESKDRHVGTIGLLSVIVHLGGILGALLSGLVLQVLEPRHLFLVMAACDLTQALICLPLARDQQRGATGRATEPLRAPSREPRSRATVLVYRLGAVMLLFYFSAFLARPFFTLYWESMSGLDNRLVAGLVYAIPGIVALAALWLGARRGAGDEGRHRVVTALLAGLLGSLLQASPQELLVLIGRGIFGWALFQGAVRLDLLLFQRSDPERYATDFSKIHVFQQLGVLCSSFAAGSLVTTHGLRAPFVVASVGFVATILLYRWLLHPGAQPAVSRVTAAL